jgi:hypothetical protein
MVPTPSRGLKTRGPPNREIPIKVDRTGCPAPQSPAVIRVYTRRADAFTDHAGEGLL